MKPLTQFIKDKQDFDKWDNNLFYSFETFCNDNKIDITDSQIYEYALDFYEDNIWCISDFGKTFKYKDCQEVFYETLTKSALSDKLIDLIDKRFGDKITNLGKNTSANRQLNNIYQVSFNSDYNFENDNKFKELLNLCNYFILKHEKDLYILKPAISEEITDVVHEQKYLYHVTSKKYLNKILKFGLQSKATDNDHIAKLYFFLNNIPEKNLIYTLGTFSSLKERIERENDIYRALKHNKKIPDNVHIDYTRVALKIDVSKIRKDIKFFKDDNYNNVRAIYTFENISPRAIVDNKVLSELSKNDKFFED